MAKIMVFVDGNWLYANMPRLAQTAGKSDFHIDYGALPRVLGASVAEQMGISDVDIVRVHFFGSYAENFDVKDEDSVARRLDFFRLLREEFHYEIELFPINFRRRRLRRKDRDPADDFEPKEKCVDIALATSLIYHAALPNGYDIALVLIGDGDYIPALQLVRRLGKRVAIASIRDSCAPEYVDPMDDARVKDCDLIWLGDVLSDIELKYEQRHLECQSPSHAGERLVMTTYRPRKGRPFFCEQCRQQFLLKIAGQRAPLTGGDEPAPAPPANTASSPPHLPCTGEITRLVRDRRFGFISGADGKDYFFHQNDLKSCFWEELRLGMKVEFEIRLPATGGKAGAAERVNPSGQLTVEPND